MTKIALITGGSRGLGQDMALAIAKHNKANIVITYNQNQEKANETVENIEALGVKALAIKLDVSDIKSLDSFVNDLNTQLQQKFNVSKIDYLINNAGYGVHKSFSQTTEQEFDNMMNVHFKGVYFLTQKLLNSMNDGGGIVNISSGLTRFSFDNYSAYASMKGAIETLTRYMAKELGSRQIRANVVAPGAIETDFGGGLVRDNQALNQQIASMTALGRVGIPDDLGGVVAFLCSEQAKWVNGQRIEVAGGIFL